MAFIGVLYVKIMGFVQRGVSISGALQEKSFLGRAVGLAQGCPKRAPCSLHFSSSGLCRHAEQDLGFGAQAVN